MKTCKNAPPWRAKGPTKVITRKKYLALLGCLLVALALLPLAGLSRSTPPGWTIDDVVDLGCGNVKCTVCNDCCAADIYCEDCCSIGYELDENGCFTISAMHASECEEFVADLNGGRVDSQKAYIHEVTDYTILQGGRSCTACGTGGILLQNGGPKRPFVLELTRTFRSRLWQYERAFGSKWQHNYDYELFLSKGATKTDVNIYFPNGGRYQFVDTGNTGVFEGKGDTSATKAVLEWQVDDLLLTTKKGSKFHFVPMDDDVNVDYRPDWIEDRNGFGLTFTYDNDIDQIDRLVQVKDGYGRTLIYEWGLLNGLYPVVTKVILPDTRQILYSFTSQDDYTVTYPNGDVSSYALRSDSDGLYYEINDARGNKGSRKHRVYLSADFMVRGLKDVDKNIIFVPRWVSDRDIRFEYASGRQETYHFNDNGYPLSMTDEHTGAVKTKSWQELGMFLTEKTDYMGQIRKFAYADSEITETTNPDGTKRYYAYSGSLLTAATNENGETTHYEYDGNGNMTKKTCPDGSFEEWTYTGYGHVESYRDRNGMEYRYEYDLYGNLSETILPDGDLDPLNNPVWTYTNDINGRRLTAKDPVNRTTTWDYDLADRVVKTTYHDNTWEEITYGTNGADPNDPAGTTGLVTTRKDRNGNVTEYEYDGLDNVITETDPLGTVVERTYLPGTDLVLTESREGDMKWNTYYPALPGNPAGRLESENVWVNASDVLTVTYEYDDLGRKSKMIDPYGFTTLYHYNDRGWLESEEREYEPGLFAVTSYDYDSVGRRIKKTDPNGQAWSTVFDTNGRVLEETLPQEGLRTYTYDPNGNRLTVTDGEGNTVTRTYTARNKVETETDPTGNTLAYAYYKDDRLKSIFNTGTGGLQSFTYYCCGRIETETILVDGGAKDIVLSYEYDGNGNRTKRIDGEGYLWETVYDERDRVIEMIDPLLKKTRYQYFDDGSPYDGRLSSGQGRAVMVTDPNNNTTLLVFDGGERLFSAADADGKTTVYGYDKVIGGRIVTEVTDREGHTKIDHADGLRRVVKEIDRLGNETRHEYDLAGNLKKITDASGNETVYVHDALYRLMEEGFADGESIQYTYYDNGRLKTKTDQMGDTTAYFYDGAGRMTTIRYANLAEDQFGYDAAGRLISAVTGLYPTGFPVTLSYDAASRILQETQSGRTVGYSYDRRSLVTSVTLPIGATFEKTYTPKGALDEVRYLSNVFVKHAYDDRGRLKEKALGNGTSTTLAYDNRDRLTQIQHSMGSTDIQTFNYEFNEEGVRTDEENATFPNRSESFDYDAKYRLTDWERGTPGGTPTKTQNWELDPLRNWDSTTVNGMTEHRTHNVVNELTAIDAAPIAYDKKGNLKDDGTYLYDYDYKNRLNRIRLKADGSLVALYFYDALGRRTVRYDNVHVEGRWYFYDGPRVVEERTLWNVIVAAYVYGHYVDEPIARLSGAGFHYYHTNGHYSVAALSDAAGAVVERYEYDPYGAVTTYDASWANPQDSSRVNNPYTFVGRRLDPEAGLIYFRLRYYSPAMGRFVKRDPGGYRDGMNLYAAYFCPTGVDPFGMEECEPITLDLPFAEGTGSKSYGAFTLDFGYNTAGAVHGEKCGECCERDNLWGYRVTGASVDVDAFFNLSAGFETQFEEDIGDWHVKGNVGIGGYLGGNYHGTGQMNFATCEEEGDLFYDWSAQLSAGVVGYAGLEASHNFVETPNHVLQGFVTSGIVGFYDVQMDCGIDECTETASLGGFVAIGLRVTGAGINRNFPLYSGDFNYQNTVSSLPSPLRGFVD